MIDDLRSAAEAWLSEDPDPDTRAELQALLNADADAELADRFGAKLEFGTAGLRGAVGAGPNRMNRVVVIRAAAGLAAYLKANGLTDGPVLIGYDARHKSDVFARDTAAVIRGAGLDAVLLDRPAPTPVVAFGIRHLNAVAGVVVTASHNPPQDNGYKVYLGDGSQIVPPADHGIAAAIDAVGPLDSVPRGDDWQTAGDDLLGAYLDRIATLVPADAPRELKVVYTPLHGVGRFLVEDAVRRAGFAVPAVVATQADPDPDFPTVAFPNPEEPGAIDAALELARSVGADLAVANDPDADRCAVAVPDPSAEGGWRMLRGDELGALLGEFLLASRPDGVAACSIVSSSLLGKIAAAYGVRYVDTLTGFKWIGRVPGLVFGYEEALGYCVDPAAVKDKDGVSTLIRVLELGARAKAQGRTLLDLLDALAIKYGLHATDQLSVRVEDLSLIAAAMDRLRATPPTTLGGHAVERVDDLSTGSEHLPPTDGLRYTLSEGARVVVRPSGTEPKLKCYLEVVIPVEGEDVPAARTRAAQHLTAIKQDLATAAGI
ncbi:Glucose-1,6-bisphosphate synthase [Kribbella flavida DSM 17836]|uniref:Glucose-1,6-bisphosphate synthase n=1 Tax=Kribbella flavida (strain DSM 17836 / JCM 10339 / NBRC 14399) TaxID=479435 RepID=D2PKI1_KRIFD|nr:phospho-sugar mutase [Kribbella flavida]ADB30493.1 Glucose-1,6-bisphosphate synthase [Kribbella flavida DSM 17836]